MPENFHFVNDSPETAGDKSPMLADLFAGSDVSDTLRKRLAMYPNVTLAEFTERLRSLRLIPCWKRHEFQGGATECTIRDINVACGHQRLSRHPDDCNARSFIEDGLLFAAALGYGIDFDTREVHHTLEMQARSLADLDLQALLGSLTLPASIDAQPLRRNLLGGAKSLDELRGHLRREEKHRAAPILVMAKQVADLYETILRDRGKQAIVVGDNTTHSSVDLLSQAENPSTIPAPCQK